MKTPTSIALAMVLLASQLALAEPAQRAEVRLSAYKVVAASADGSAKESRQPLQQLRPGDTVEYEAVYVNRSGETARDVQLTVPVPSGGLEYMATQTSPRAPTASIDGAHFAALPLLRTETLASGERVTKPVPLAEYRALRWSLGDLPAGATRSVSARMQLPAVPAAAVVLAHD